MLRGSDGFLKSIENDDEDDDDFLSGWDRRELLV
jgi:hypothetical protein